MSERVRESLESSQESRFTAHASRLTVFEPEILAFCCEH
jgi:hypothetical protein